MPDISMCRNEKCKKKFRCYRFMAIPNTVQLYAQYEPIDGKCDRFWPIEGRKIRMKSKFEISKK